MTFLYPSAIPYQSLSNILAFYIILLLSGNSKQAAINPKRPDDRLGIKYPKPAVAADLGKYKVIL